MHVYMFVHANTQIAFEKASMPPERKMDGKACLKTLQRDRYRDRDIPKPMAFSRLRSRHLYEGFGIWVKPLQT